MASARVFQVALVDRVSPVADYFNPHTKNEITYTIFDHLMEIAKVTPGRFIPGPGWSYRPAHVQPHDVVIYFLLDSGQSLVRKKLGVEPPTTDGGCTYFNGAVTLSEVYVDGSMPATRLANVAFHELMHNKLKLGDGMHVLGGVAAKPTQENSRLNPESIRRMSKALFNPVPQYTKAMAE